MASKASGASMSSQWPKPLTRYNLPAMIGFAAICCPSVKYRSVVGKPTVIQITSTRKFYFTITYLYSRE